MPPVAHLPTGMVGPHDSLFRDTFGKPEHAGPLLRALLPPALATAIEWDSLEPAPTPQVDAGLQSQQQDLLFTVRLGGRPALLYVLFEHKARPDRWTVLQVLAYVVGLWREQRRRRPAPRRLPPIVPVVVSFGRRRWRTATDLTALLDLEVVPTEVRSAALDALPQFRIAPRDFAAMTPADVRAMGLSLLGLWTVAAQQFVAPVGHDDDAAVKAIAEWADVARQLLLAPTGQQAFATLSSYLLQTTRLGRRLGVVFEQHIGAKAMKKFESSYDRITRESRAEGRAEGKAEGRAEMILWLLGKRFGTVPAADAQRVRGGTERDLDRWADRILDAKTLDELFAD